MRILVVSNLYPPHHVGGYELGCQQVVDELHGRGHDIRVLTSTFGVDGPTGDGFIHRELKFRTNWPDGPGLIPAVVQHERHNQKSFSRQVADFAPDVVYLWNVQFGLLSLAFVADRLGVPTSYFVSDGWFARFGCNDAVYPILHRPQPSVKRRIGRGAMRTALKIAGCIVAEGVARPGVIQFCSEHLQNAAAHNLTSCQSEVIHWGVDMNRFGVTSPRSTPGRLLFVGRLVPTKGVLTAVRGFLKVAEESGDHDLTLTIAGGGGLKANCEPEIRELARQSPAGDCVQFVGKRSSQEMPELYSQHDVLMFPTEIDEPFSISLVEAMASGLAVVGTQTGGTPELLVDGETGVTFESGNVEDCARAIRRLVSDHDLFHQVGQRGQQIARSQFTLSEMVTKIESSLCAAVPVAHTSPRFIASDALLRKVG